MRAHAVKREIYSDHVIFLFNKSTTNKQKHDKSAGTSHNTYTNQLQIDTVQDRPRHFLLNSTTLPAKIFTIITILLLLGKSIIHQLLLLRQSIHPLNIYIRGHGIAAEIYNNHSIKDIRPTDSHVPISQILKVSFRSLEPHPSHRDISTILSDFRTDLN